MMEMHSVKQENIRRTVTPIFTVVAFDVMAFEDSKMLRLIWTDNRAKRDVKE